MFIFKTVPEVCIRCLIDILLCVFYVPFHAKLNCHLEHECGWLAASMIQNCIRSDNSDNLDLENGNLNVVIEIFGV